MRTTKAAILTQINQLLEIDELIIPELKRGQVLVKVAYSGICHSQLNEIRGLKGEDKFLPHTLGHEGSGIVLEAGPEVQKVTVGDHVVLTWIKGNGLDIPATQYHRHDASIVNSGAISTFMEYSIISENRLVPIPCEMPLKEAALLGCAIPTGAGIVMNTARVRRGNSVAVFGVGGIGLSAILAAKMMGAAVIIAVDIREQKLIQARKIGATHIINASSEDVLEKIHTITGGQGVDFAIEAAGQRETMETAFKSVKDKDGLCILAGNLPAGHQISIDPFDLIKGKRIIGTWGGETDPERDIPIYVDHFLSGRLNLSLFTSNIYWLDKINDSFNDLATGKVNRALIEFL
ncbi:MAG: zinc-binding dehydrogenase [Methylococcaceae bacterium]|jgi:S-(hydroxymethyl)glutathione dehydrogenase/alcohol dehydrogenase